jgi:pyridoxamine 5'-phosphate oxidase
MSEPGFSEISRTLAGLGRDHEDVGLVERDLDPNPFRQFHVWLEDSLTAGLVLPNAMTLATASPDAVPSARMVLLKALDEHGFVFFTNYESRKGRELDTNPRAALVFHWSQLERQVRVVGGAERVTPEESAEYFGTRAMGSKLGAWASRQSEVIDNRIELEQRVRQFADEYRDRPVPPPPYWGGYRVIPTEIEFWQGRSDRLHDRFSYRRSSVGEEWTIVRLSP